MLAEFLRWLIDMTSIIPFGMGAGVVIMYKFLFFHGF